MNLVIKHILVVLVLFLFVISNNIAQEVGTITDLKTRHRFAQTGFGLYTSYLPSTKVALNQNVDNQDHFNFDSQVSPQLNFSGMHFWGKVDFYINIPLASLRFKKEDSPDYTLNSGADTGIKFFLWKTPYKVVSPFIGTSFQSVSFDYNSSESIANRGAVVSRVRFPLHFGIAKIFNDRHYCEFSATYYPRTEIEYYFDRSAAITLRTPPLRFKIGYRYILDTTLSAEKGWQDGTTAQITQSIAEKGKLNSFVLAIGPSAAFFLSNDKNPEKWPHLGKQNEINLFMDLGVGYYHHNLDLQVGLSYRSNKSEKSAFNTSRTFERKVWSAEAIKFIGDYHGFVPFLGVSVGLENLKVTELDRTVNFEMQYKDKKLWPGIILGWDIRPNRLQGFILRTNIRYFPGLKLNTDGIEKKTFYFDQLEINFIQAVFHLDRLFK